MSLKLVKETVDVTNIAEQIRSGVWKNTKKFNTDLFVKEVAPKQYVPNQDMILQVRSKTFDNNFVQTTLNKMKETGDTSRLSKGTVIYFPEETEYQGEIIPAGSIRKINGSHTIVMKAYLEIIESEFNVVDFKLDLNSDTNLIRTLGNLLNDTFFNEQGLTDDSIKLDIWERMDKRDDSGLDVKLPRKEQDELLSFYTQLTQGSLTNYMSWHKKGGRRKAFDEVLPIQLQNYWELMSSSEAYKNEYTIIQPHAASDYKNSALARVIIESMEQNKKKVLVLLYPTSAPQKEQIDSGEHKKTTTAFYKKIAERYGFEKIEVQYIPTKNLS